MIQKNLMYLRNSKSVMHSVNPLNIKLQDLYLINNRELLVSEVTAFEIFSRFSFPFCEKPSF